MSTVSAEWNMQCPSCGDDRQIDVLAQIYVRLTPDGTDADISDSGSHEWGDTSSAHCRACDFYGEVKDFRLPLPIWDGKASGGGTFERGE